jgi:P27 family predicted phage terminase small subunit
MVNQPVPVEKKRMLGNPGKRALPGEDAVVLHSGRVDAPEDLGAAGLRLWERVFGEGEIWISPRLDVELLERTCRALDRLVVLDKLFEDDPAERKTVMSINETEKLLASNLGLLGFTPADRARLGLAEIKRQSKLEELMARNEEQ